ncbi:MAG: hypothetical protein R6W72_03005 [Desulfurivibrionaceae bacterium]
MAKIYGGKFIWLLVAALLVFTGPGVGETRAEAGDRTVSGVIAEDGFGRFILRSDAGKSMTFNTGRATEYQPDDFRPHKGDKVKVTYYDMEARGKTVQAVSLLKLIKANPNFKEPPNPATGTIKEAGRRAFDIHIPAIDKAWKFEVARGWKTIPKGWKPAAGDKVKVSYNRVPSRFTSSYVYQLETMEKR